MSEDMIQRNFRGRPYPKKANNSLLYSRLLPGIHLMWSSMKILLGKEIENRFWAGIQFLFNFVSINLWKPFPSLSELDLFYLSAVEQFFDFIALRDQILFSSFWWYSKIKVVQ